MVGALAAALLACSTSYAASFGHSRVVSALGQPLRIDVPITRLTADDLRSLAVRPAPADDWKQAGLVPPVDLATLQLRLVDGYTPGTRILQLRSSQAFDRPVADLLLDVRTASGQQRYQVSLLTQAGPESLAAQRSSALRGSGQSAGTQGGDQQVPQKSIHVKQGDTMFAIALRNAVSGVSVYQMMIALQRANPQAFIQNNVNLVKAGATLAMPDMAALTAISDKEARRIFMQQAQAFALYRQRLAGGAPAVGQEAGAAASGTVSAAGQPEQREPARESQDQLRLSGSQPAPGGRASGNGAAGGSAGDADTRADDRVAARKGIQDSEQRVSQLEENVKHLSQALQAQGGAATDLVVGGAKGLSQTLADAASAVTGGSPDSAAEGNQSSGASAAAAAGGEAADKGAAAASSGGHAGSASGSGNGATAAAEGAAGNGAATDGSNADGASGGSTARPGSDAAALAAGGAGQGAGGQGGSTAGGDAAAGKSDAASGAAGGNSAGNGTAPGSSDASPAGGASANGTAADGVQAGSATANGAPANAGAAASGAAASGSTANSSTANGAAAGGAAVNGGSSASQAGNTSAARPGASAGAGGSASASPDNANGAAQADSTKAEQTVSWFQEHMLGVITGVLAFIVLIIAWLLRRANTGRHDDNQGVITESMVKEKLDQINLDLEQEPSSGSRSGRS
ncbi:MAG TPA: FimV/HubP family polar landmark protein [Burkholderiaceae bacterium]|nr:FimV/HubP family polar landmark protein [Burkholderiaceae bacterium]